MQRFLIGIRSDVTGEEWSEGYDAAAKGVSSLHDALDWANDTVAQFNLKERHRRSFVPDVPLRTVKRPIYKARTRTLLYVEDPESGERLTVATED